MAFTAFQNEFSSGNVPVVYEDDDVIVCVKPAGMPTAPLSEDDSESVLSVIAERCPSVRSVRGKKAVEGGLLHRIDTATTGLVLIAKQQSAWDFLSVEQDAGRFVKTYTAFCYQAEALAGASSPVGAKPGSEGTGNTAGDTICTVRSFFRGFGEKSRGVKPVFAESGRADKKKAGTREYDTHIVSVEGAGTLSGDGTEVFRVTARITAGYRHQVRAHLAAIGYPVLGDPLYPALWLVDSAGLSEPTESATHNPIPLYFFASGISVCLPSGKQLTAEMPESFLFPLPDRMNR